MQTTDPAIGGDDTISGDAGNDLILGGTGGDTIRGNLGTDILFGDQAKVVLVNGLYSSLETTNRLIGGVDTIYGGDQDDIIVGGTNADSLDGGMDRDLIFGDNVLLTMNAGSGNAIDPRFRALTGTVIYGTSGLPQVAGEFGAAIQPVPGGRPIWSDWTITLDQLLDPAQFGNDYIAGGGGNDEIFGQLGDDTIQGDGSIDSKVNIGHASLVRSAARLEPGILTDSERDDHRCIDHHAFVRSGDGR